MKNKKNTMPSFLKPNFEGFNFEFSGEKLSLKDETFKQELLLIHGKKNTLILLDGKLLYNSLPKDIEVSFSRLHRFVSDYRKKPTEDYVLNENKIHLNSSLVIVSKTKAKKQKINLIFALTSETYHYTYVEVAKESNLEIFEKVVGRNNSKLNYVLNVEAKDNANVKYTCFQSISGEKSQVFTQVLQAYRDAVLGFEYLNLNKANTMNLSYGNLLANGAEMRVGSCSFASGTTRMKNLIILSHKAKHTKSNIDNVAVANNFASYEIDGVGKIDASFSKSDAQQKSKIIVLKDAAKVVANPQLFINEFDVKAGHSAGVGTLDENQIYYLQSRGLSREKSIELLILALSESFLIGLSASQKQEVLALIKRRIK